METLPRSSDYSVAWVERSETREQPRGRSRISLALNSGYNKSLAGGSAVNIEARQIDRSAKTKVQIIDCDIHPKASIEDYRPYLSNRWWDYAQT
jgi:hypothetical protein